MPSGASRRPLLNSECDPLRSCGRELRGIDCAARTDSHCAELDRDSKIDSNFAHCFAYIGKGRLGSWPASLTTMKWQRHRLVLAKTAVALVQDPKEYSCRWLIHLMLARRRIKNSAGPAAFIRLETAVYI